VESLRDEEEKVERTYRLLGRDQTSVTPEE